MSPFYPIKAKQKGVTVGWIGIVMGTMAVFQIISSSLVGRYLQKLGGRTTVIFIATLMIIAQSIILGMLEYVESDEQFLYLSFLAQLLGGLGCGANSTSSMAILSSYNKDEREKYIGLVELFFGLGLLFGPIFGAFFYSLGGYMMPFISFGKLVPLANFVFPAVLYLVFFPMIIYVMLKASRLSKLAAQQQTSAVEESPAEKVDIDLVQLLKRPRFTFGLLSQGFISMSLLYVQPTLSLHLHNYGYTPDQIAFSFGIPAILYACACPFMYLLT